MRYAKKLALHQLGNADHGAPYISHRALKSMIEKATQLLRRGKLIKELDASIFKRVEKDTVNIGAYIE